MLIIDTFAMVYIVYWSRKNDGLSRDKPEGGLFRMVKEPLAPPPPARKTRGRAR